MKPSTNSNLVTVNWQNNIVIDNKEAPVYPVTTEDISVFQRDGVVLLRGASSDWVEILSKGFQRNLEDPQSYAFPCESNPGGQPGRFFDSYCNWQLIPEYLDYLTHSSVASMAGQLMQSTHAQFFHEHVFLKAPGTQRATPWHQDLPYYCVDGIQTASVYISLDQADADVAVRFVKGSHLWGKLYSPRVFEDGSNLNGDESLGMDSVPDIDANPEAYDIATWELEPGDTIVFDYRTLHGTGDTEVKTMRRAFSTRWIGDDVTYCERPGETSPPYVNHGMKHGDSMREDWFPVFWRQH